MSRSTTPRVASVPARASTLARAPTLARAATVALALASALALLAPTAVAHFEEANLNAGRLEAGPYIVSFLTSPAVVYKGASTTLSVQAAPAATGTPMRGNEVTIRAIVAGPGPFSDTKTMSPDGRGYYLATVNFPATGVYNVRIELEGEQHGAGAATTQVEVFPDLPVRIRPLDLALIVTANRSTTFDFEIVNSTLLTRDDRVQDITMRVEHWADDHARKISEQEVTGARLGQGTWRFVMTPTSSGMHHMRFASASGGFNYDETPPLHAYVDPDVPETIAEETRDSPFPGAALAVAAALAALALSRRRAG